MKYRDLKKAIKAESKKDLAAYIAVTEKESLVSNFIDNPAISDNQLIKAVEEGLLEKDYDTYIVVK